MGDREGFTIREDGQKKLLSCAQASHPCISALGSDSRQSGELRRIKRRKILELVLGDCLSPSELF